MSDRAEFEKWCIAQKDEHGLPFFVTKGDDGKYIDHDTVVAWEAWQSARAESGQGAEPVGWQFYQDGKWWYGDDRIKDHRKNTEEAGFRVRDVYASSPQPPQENNQ